MMVSMLEHLADRMSHMMKVQLSYHECLDILKEAYDLGYSNVRSEDSDPQLKELPAGSNAC